MRVTGLLLALIGIALVPTAPKPVPPNSDGTPSRIVGESSEVSRLIAQGQGFIDQDKFTEAAEALHSAIRLHPESAEAHAVLGFALIKLEKYADAEAECRKSSELRRTCCGKSFRRCWRRWWTTLRPTSRAGSTR